MSRRSGRAPGSGELADEELQERLAELFEKLLYDIVRLGAGESVQMPYAEARVRQALAEPFIRLRARGVDVETQFSEPVALGVAYVDAERKAAIWVELETDEWTTYEAVDGTWNCALPCRQRRLVAEVDSTSVRILRLGRGAI